MSENLEEFKEKFGQMTYGRSREQCLNEGICIQCGCDAKDFRNEISEREFKLTVWCQKCQDNFFGYD